MRLPWIQQLNATFFAKSGKKVFFYHIFYKKSLFLQNIFFLFIPLRLYIYNKVYGQL